MKKLVLSLVVVLFAVVAMAQKYTYVPANDTLNNAETIYLTLDQAVSETFVAALAVTADTLSGANATVTATLQEYVESGKWVDNGNAVTLINAGDVAEKSYIFKLTDTPALGYRVKLVQTGTAATKVTGKFVFKKKQGIF